MTNIEYYLNDGANYQAQMILCYLRNREIEIAEDCHLEGEDFLFSTNHIEVGRFENCREQGYIFGLNIRSFKWVDDKWMVVENRSSDSIRIRHFKANTLNTPSIDVTFNEEYLIEEKFFPCEDIINAGRYILNGMRKCVDDYMESDEFQYIKEKHAEKFGKK